ncbi:hypothetical protein [Micromonospora coxensis]|uniref:hypothetical protein n=1 Tax=Micromonospora coxensis TaxID=356852 RepID=UPI0012FE1D80|nr:hypothetical protein [Micromonospora coxensis]
MTIYEAVAAVVDILLAGAAVALVGCAAWVAVRRPPTVRLLGRTLHHPRLWAAAAACMGFYVLLGLGHLTEVTPSTWRTPSRWAAAVLLLAAVVLMLTHSILEYRARRRIARAQQPRP